MTVRQEVVAAAGRAHDPDTCMHMDCVKGRQQHGGQHRVTTDAELLAALKTLVEESIGDFIYNIRERVLDDSSFTGNTWDHPRVKAYSDAVGTIEKYVREAGQ